MKIDNNDYRQLADQKFSADAVVIVSFVELLTREMIIHMNPHRHPELNQILMPLSWVNALAHKYRHIHHTSRTEVECMADSLLVIRRLSLELRFGTPGQTFH